MLRLAVSFYHEPLFPQPLQAFYRCFSWYLPRNTVISFIAVLGPIIDRSCSNRPHGIAEGCVVGVSLLAPLLLAAVALALRAFLGVKGHAANLIMALPIAWGICGRTALPSEISRCSSSPEGTPSETRTALP